TSTSPIVFDVVFSEPVTGLDGSDFDTSASTVGGTLAVSLSGSGSVYQASVTGMTTSGDVVLSLPAGAAQDMAANLSLASTSVDNVVTWEEPPVDTTPPEVTVEEGAAQVDPTSA